MDIISGQNVQVSGNELVIEISHQPASGFNGEVDTSAFLGRCEQVG